MAQLESKYKKYAEYKDSGVEWLGEIPSHWDSKPLKYLCTYNDEVLPETTPKDDEIQYIDIGSVSAVDGISEIETMIFKDAPSRARRIVRDGDVIVSTVRTYLEAIAPIDNPPENLIVSTGFAVIRPNQYLYKSFASYCLRAKGFIKEVVARSVGVSYPAINSSELVNITIPSVEYSEQIKIANFLDHETAKIDSLITKQQKLIELLKEKRQAVISHAVTKGLNPNIKMKDSGVEWLGEVPEHWAVAKLAYRYEVLLGKMLDESKITGNYLGKYLRNTDVQWGRINSENLPEMDFRPHEVQRYSVKQGDLLVCEGGEIGRCAIWKSESTCFYQKALHRLRAYSTEDSHKFMFYVLFDSVHRERFISGAGKATIAHLPAETFKQYRFAFPPKIEQDQIVEYLDKMSEAFDGIELKALDQIDLLKERRTALISSAVTGKIDVHDWQNPNLNNSANNNEAQTEQQA